MTGVRERGTTADAALLLAVLAAAAGIAAALLAAVLLVPTGQEETLPIGSPGPLLARSGLAPAAAVVSWILAVAAAWTALVARRADRSDRRARAALAVSAPGALLGTIAVIVATTWILSWDPVL